METSKTIPKNKIKNKKGQQNKKQLANKKSKRNLTKKSIRKNSKNKNRFFFFWGPILSLLFSCYALAALQPPTINQDIRHKTITRSTISTLSSFNDNSMLKKEKKRQRLGGSTYTGAGRVSTLQYSKAIPWLGPKG